MKIRKLSEMKGGWFVGNFDPTLYQTNNVEVAVKRYRAGSYEKSHYHKVATEITVIVSGIVKMNGTEYSEGDIIIIEPNEATDFYAVTDSVNAVIKIPGANNDKYLVEEKTC